MEYYHLPQLLQELGEPLGAKEAEMKGRYFCAITLWMMDLKIYRHTELGFYYVEFFDVLEALVKKTIFKPQTLKKIYDNENKETLIEGLQHLWDEKSQLLIDDQKYMQSIEEIRYYYGLKNRKRNYLYECIKVQLPILCWVILRISHNLRKAAKARKKKILDPQNDVEQAGGKGKELDIGTIEETKEVLGIAQDPNSEPCSICLSAGSYEKQNCTDSCETIKEDNIFVLQSDERYDKLLRMQRVLSE